MSKEDSLQRFIEAQRTTYQTALAEIENGRKETHWIWFIFPQVKGLGFSHTSKFYAIKTLEEADEYLHHEILGERLKKISEALLTLPSNDPVEVLGIPDNQKLQSCMTLFAALSPSNSVFHKVLNKYFQGEQDKRTLQIIGKE